MSPSLKWKTSDYHPYWSLHCCRRLLGESSDLLIDLLTETLGSSLASLQCWLNIDTGLVLSSV